MTLRTISGIPDKLWEKFGDNYDNRSKRIRELIQEDLQELEDNPEKIPEPTPIENADMTPTQKKAVRQLLKDGIKEKNDQQFRSYMERFYSQKEHKKHLKAKIDAEDDIPYKLDGTGIESTDIKCKGCGVENPVKAWSKIDFTCRNCGLKVIDV